VYKNLLVPIANDDDPMLPGMLRVAGEIRSEGGKITLLHVVEAVPGFVQTYLPEDTQTRHRRDAEAMLERIADGLAGPVATVVVEGHGGRAILQPAGPDRTDCIVMGSHRPGFQDVFFGSTAAHVVRHAPCSVHVVR